MAAKSKKEEQAVDTNAWMTTYTDLMILLLTFFVLLLSMSTSTEKKRLEALNSLTGAFGFKQGGHAIIGSPKGVNITIGSSPMTKESIEFQNIQNIIAKNTMDPDVNVIREPERLVISLNNTILFDHGSSEINPARIGFLRDLGRCFKDSAHIIELRGYCATSEIALDAAPLNKAVMLSTQRAFAVFRFFEKRLGISPEKLVAHGFGNNSVPRGGMKKKDPVQRQVEIVLDYRDPVPYRLKNPKKDTLLDFKGFLFKFPGGK